MAATVTIAGVAEAAGVAAMVTIVDVAEVVAVAMATTEAGGVTETSVLAANGPSRRHAPRRRAFVRAAPTARLRSRRCRRCSTSSPKRFSRAVCPAFARRSIA